VTGARSIATDGARGSDHVGRAGIVGPVAHLGSVAEVGGWSADAGALQVGGTRRPRACAGFGQVTGAGSRTTHGRGGRGPGPPAGDARAGAGFDPRAETRP